MPGSTMRIFTMTPASVVSAGSPTAISTGTQAPESTGHCPMGHGKSLDPHWSPDDYD